MGPRQASLAQTRNSGRQSVINQDWNKNERFMGVPKTYQDDSPDGYHEHIEYLPKDAAKTTDFKK